MRLTRSPTAFSLLLLLLVLAAGATYTDTSYAAFTTIGPPVLSTASFENDASGGTYIQYSGTMPAPEYVSPIEGTIVRWRIASGSAASPVRLRVLRPAGGGKFTGVGTSAVEMTSSSPPDTFATSLPIEVGDIIGVDNSSSALIFATGVPGDSMGLFHPELVDGSPAAEPELRFADNGFQLQVNADIQSTSSGGGDSGGTSGGGTSGGGGGIAPIAPIAPSQKGVEPTLPRLNSTMTWTFDWTRHYTIVESLTAHEVPKRGYVAVFCKGRGCAFTSHRSTSVGSRKPCGRHKCSKHAASQGPDVGLVGLFKDRHLRVGARISVSILKAGSIGKSFVFTVRANRAPSVSVACLAPGSSQPGQGC